MRFAFVLLCLLLPGLAHGQDFVIGGHLSKAQVEELRKQAVAGEKARQTLDALAAREVKLKVGRFFPFRFGNPNQLWLWSDESICKRLDVPAGQKFALWGMVEDEKEPSLHAYDAKPEPWGHLIGAKAGTTSITVLSNGENGGPPVVLDRLTIVVEGDGPKPPEPPGPGPNPPGPTPIPTTGFRVLIVWETKDLSTYPSSQIAAVNAREVREYLNAKCVKVGSQPEWRVYDPDTDVSRESKIWQDAMKIKRDKLPWIVVSDGVKGTSEPLPADKDALMNLLKTYGGN
jgi:hypothetical protein